MATADAKHFAKKNQARRITFGLYNATDDLVSAATSLDSEVSKDGGAFADCTNEATEIGTSGIYTLDLTATEMNADTVAIQVKSGTAKTHVAVIYTVDLDLEDLGGRLGPWSADTAKNSIYGALRSLANDVDSGFECNDLIKNDGAGAGTFTADASQSGIRSILDLAILWVGATAAESGSGLAAIVGPSGLSTTNDKYLHGDLVVLTGPAAGDVRAIVGYNGSTRTLTPDRNFSAAIQPGDTFFIRKRGPSLLTPAERSLLADAVWDEPTIDHVTSGTITNTIQSITSSQSFIASAVLTTGVPVKSSGITASSFAANAITTNSINDGAITAAKIGADAITAAKVAPDVHEENADTLFDRPNAIESGWTLRGLLRVIGAVLVGKSSGVAAGSPVYRNLTDTKNRVSGTATNGDRTAITYDQT